MTKDNVDQENLISFSDIALVQAAQQNSNAEEVLLRRLYPKIFGVAMMVVGNRQSAEDISQVAALEVIKSLSSFQGTGSIESWAGRITYRVSTKMMKKEWEKQKSHIPLDTLNETEKGKPAPHGNPETTLTRRKLYQTLLYALEIIPQKRRNALLLHLAHGYTVKEVAELMDISPNTVKDRLRTAYQEFRVIIDEHPTLRSEILEEIS
ncbi:MAG: sigma-70 family RNA polymerase sigma factor [Deltaproteobacteria bacterium]|nr:sigma-70 family RNA polymerase sigma factor [Deltaproteobacteria bacterium]